MINDKQSPTATHKTVFRFEIYSVYNPRSKNVTYGLYCSVHLHNHAHMKDLIVDIYTRSYSSTFFEIQKVLREKDLKKNLSLKIQKNAIIQLNATWIPQL